MSQRRRGQHHFAADRQWRDVLQCALDVPTATRRARSRSKPLIRVICVSKSGNKVEIEMRFRSRATYCCAEPGCHLPGWSAEWWRWVRGRIAEMTDRKLPPMTLMIRGVVEAGAKLRYGRPAAIASTAYTFLDGPWRERDARPPS